MKRTLIALFTAAALLAACQSEPSGPPDPSPDLALPDPGTVTVSVDVDTPILGTYLMGSTSNKVATYKFCVSGAPEPATIPVIIPGVFYTNRSALKVYTNAKTTDNNDGITPYGTQGQFLETVEGKGVPGYAFHVVKGSTLKIPNDTCKSIDLRVDLLSFEESGVLTTGQEITPVLLQSYSNIPGDNAPTVIALSSTTRRPMKVVILDSGFGGPYRGAYAAKSIAYRATVGINWSADTPTGASTAAADQLIGKFVVFNTLTPARYSTPINNITIDLKSQAITTQPRVLNIFKDSQGGAPIATYTFPAGALLNGPILLNLTGVVNASGSARTLFATLDTTDMSIGKRLAVRIVSVGWSDGVTANITLNADLPLAYKDFIY